MDKTLKKSKDALLAQNLVTVLSSQKQLGGSAYPPTLHRLAELTDPAATKTQVLKAAQKKDFKGKAIAARGKDLDSPVALLEDAEHLGQSPRTLEYVLSTKRTGSTHAQSVSDLAKAVTDSAGGRVRKAFRQWLDNGLKQGTLPPTVGWVRMKTPKLFLLADLHPPQLRLQLNSMSNAIPSQLAAHERPGHTSANQVITSTNFADPFEGAFDHLDRRSGGHNFVSLVDLRRDLSAFPRDEFNAGLRVLRQAGRFTLSSAQSKHGITAEEREAGIEEGGTLLLHVSRRTS